MDVATGELVDGPIDRARYSPVAWLLGGAGLLLRPPARPVPRAGRRGAVPPPGLAAPGRHRPGRRRHGLRRRAWTRSTTTACTCSWDGRWLSVTASSGTAPRTDAWLADLAATGPEQPDFTVVQEGVDANTSIFVSRDGRAYVSTDRDAPRGRLAVVDPADPAYEHWVDLLPGGPGGGARGLRDPGRARARRRRACCWPRGPGTPISEVTRARPGDRRAARLAGAARPRHHRRPGRAARGRPRVVVRLHRLPHPEQRPALRRDDRRARPVGESAWHG